MIGRIRSLLQIQNYSMYVVMMLMIGISMALTSPYLSLYCTKVIGISPGSYGLLMALVALSGVLINTILAKYSDNGMNRKMVIIIAVLFYASGYITFLLIHNYVILLIAIPLLMGLGAPAVPQIFAAAREAVNTSETVNSTFANSLLRSLFSMGFLVGPLVGSILLTGFGYEGVFLGTFSGFIGIAVLVLVLLRQGQGVGIKPTVNVRSIQNIEGGHIGLRNKYVLLPFITLILLNMCNVAYNLNIPLFVVNELHGTNTQAGWVISLSAGLEIPLMIGLGGVAARIGNKKMMLIGGSVDVVYHLIVLNSTALWQILAGQLLQASFVAMVIAIALSYFQDLLPTLPGLATILYMNASTLGQLLGNLSGGWVAELAGSRNVSWMCLGLLVVSLILLTRTKATLVPSRQSTQTMI